MDNRLEALADLVADGGTVVLSGAGISTASGIPDYRGPTGRHRTSAPMQWSDFRDSEQERRRYWARALVGFRRFGDVTPNVAHDAIATLQRAGLVDAVLTQNVDGLHQLAGSEQVVELHGTLAEVICMGCAGRRDRHDLQRALEQANPWLAVLQAPIQADGDAALDDARLVDFVVTRCECGADYRPDVVFFGEHVPRERMVLARALLTEARTVLVAGSSLQVGTGYLLLRHAMRSGASVAIVNQGPTRADHLVKLRLDADVTDILPRLCLQIRPQD